MYKEQNVEKKKYRHTLLVLPQNFYKSIAVNHGIYRI